MENRIVDYRFLSETGVPGYNFLSGLGLLIRSGNIITIDEFGQLYNAYARFFTIVYTDDIGVSQDDIGKQSDSYKSILESLQTLDLLFPASSFYRTLIDSLSVTDFFQSTTYKILTDVLGLLDVIGSEYRKATKTEHLFITDKLYRGFSKSLSDLLGLVDSIEYSWKYTNVETVGVADVLSNMLYRSKLDILGILDSLNYIVTKPTKEEVIGVLDALTLIFTMLRSKADDLTITDNLLIACIYRTIFQDVIGIADSLGLVVNYNRVQSSNVTIYDRLLRDDIIPPPLSYNTKLQIAMQINGKNYSETVEVIRAIILEITESIN